VIAVTSPTGPDADAPSRREAHRLRVQQLLAGAARGALAFDGRLTDRVVTDICDQVGITRSSFRTFFATDDELLDAVTALLVAECVERQRLAVAEFRRSATRTAEGAALALATTRPLDRTGLVIRADRRLRALTSPEPHLGVVKAEREFGVSLTGVLQDLLLALGREFSWPPALATRVIVDSYERSFAAWLLSGDDEADFPRSPFVARTLPRLLLETSRPIGSA
jgi:hypothetical protein